MTMSLAAARLALRRARVRQQLARLELMHAIRAVQAAMPDKNTTPALLRRQAE